MIFGSNKENEDDRCKNEKSRSFVLYPLITGSVESDESSFSNCRSLKTSENSKQSTITNNRRCLVKRTRGRMNSNASTRKFNETASGCSYPRVSSVKQLIS